MRLFDWADGSKEHRRLLVLFGEGLIGSAIGRRLWRATDASSDWRPYDWTSVEGRAGQLTLIRGEIEERAAKGLSGVAILWSGGCSGFSSPDADVEEELTCFREIVEFARDLRTDMPTLRHEFHMVSSAGGLFEGSTVCDVDTLPTPSRSYGFGKLRQEELARQSLADSFVRIYRPSSVYGYQPGGRAGLIVTLARNAFQSKVTRIVGDLSTIRDYVHVEDIANFVSRKIVYPSARQYEVETLASGVPTPLFEVLQVARETLKLPILTQFDSTRSNARNISFRPACLPEGWSAVPVRFGIRNVLADISRSFFRMD